MTEPDEEARLWAEVDLLESKLKSWMRSAPYDINIRLCLFPQAAMDPVLAMEAERLPLHIEINMFFGNHVEVIWVNMDTDDEVSIKGYPIDGDMDVDQVLEQVMDQLRSFWA
jgi:hypothetical protein